MSGTESGEEMEVKEILGEKKNSKGHWFLVRWAGYGAADDTWEKKKSLTNASALINQFYEKMSQTKQLKKPRKKSTSRSRSRTRSTSRGRTGSKSGSRSVSRSPGRPRGRSARSTKAETTTTVTTKTTPNIEETKTETVTESPGRFQKTTETIQRNVYSPSESQISSYVQRTTEVTTQTRPAPHEVARPKGWCTWMGSCCQHLRDSRQCLADLFRTDYTALVVFGVISILMLSFVVENNVDFPKLWESIVGFFVGIWAWLTSLVRKN